MINAVTVTNYLGETIRLELAHPENSGFAIQSIDGLGPGKATINMSELSSTDGSIYNSARVGTRNIIFNLLFLEKQTIENTRQIAYKYFPIKQPLTILFETDNRSCSINGYVESNEPSIFSAQEGTQISILCPDPNFYSVEKVITIFCGIEDAFEFPFSNEGTCTNLLDNKQIQYQMGVTSGTVGTNAFPTIQTLKRCVLVYPVNSLTTYILSTDLQRLVLECNSSGTILASYDWSKSNLVFTTKKTTTQIIILFRKDSSDTAFLKETEIYGTTNKFELGTSENSYVPLYTNEIEFGLIKNSTSQTVYYFGDSSVGVDIDIYAVGSATNIIIYNTTTKESMKIDTTKLIALTGSGIVGGDRITISTVTGNKVAMLLRNGVYTNIRNCLDRYTDWFQLTRGDNVFTFTADTGLTNLQFRIENRIIYEGV